MSGQELIVAVMGWLRRYVALSDQQALVLGLWALHTWIYERLSRTTPYLEITGVSGSGKTTCMEALSQLSRGGLILNTLRTLAMCRYIADHEGQVTIFVDEAERLSSATFGDQRSMLASGYRKGGEHLVSAGKGTVMFPVWCPKVFTAVRTMTPVLHNRCIPIWLERGTPEASLSLEYERAEATAAELVANYKGVLAGIPRPLTVEADWLANERDREIWTPLVSLAATLQLDQATLDALTAASVDLSALRGIERNMDRRVEDEAAKERSYAVLLIRDVCAVLRDDDRNVLSRDLVERLRAIPTAPWRSYNRAGLNELSMAQLLGAFGLETNQTVQVGRGRKGRTVGKGYKVSDLRAACRGVQG